MYSMCGVCSSIVFRREYLYKRTYSFVVITCHSCWAPCSYIMPLYVNNNKNPINSPCCCCCSVCFYFINDNFLYSAYRPMLCGSAFKMWNIKVSFLAVGRCFGKVKRLMLDVCFISSMKSGQDCIPWTTSDDDNDDGVGDHRISLRYRLIQSCSFHIFK